MVNIQKHVETMVSLGAQSTFMVVFRLYVGLQECYEP